MVNLSRYFICLVQIISLFCESALVLKANFKVSLMVKICSAILLVMIFMCLIPNYGISVLIFWHHDSSYKTFLTMFLLCLNVIKAVCFKQSE